MQFDTDKYRDYLLTSVGDFPICPPASLYFALVLVITIVAVAYNVLYLKVEWRHIIQKSMWQLFAAFIFTILLAVLCEAFKERGTQVVWAIFWIILVLNAMAILGINLFA